MKRILLTTTSLQNTPGVHHQLLAEGGYDIVRERGPLSEARMLEPAPAWSAKSPLSTSPLGRDA
ncbi:hypothetical protein MASR2M8_14460 [Opitutaceae bacterium]